ncbi:MAG: hypothetical protein D3910_25330 [Candidatus Electrothrix sp. ATG2]|nr:hypothetical protein [Candidatus Electrothrix sp. ATG2]
MLFDRRVRCSLCHENHLG